MTLQPRVVQVRRRTEYDEMMVRHSTRHQATFFLKQRGRHIDELDHQRRSVEQARELVAASIPSDWRRAEVERSDLQHFSFAPGDIVVVVGQDGLVANVAKYLDGQPVIGINPDAGRNPGILVPHKAADAAALLEMVETGQASYEQRTMVMASADDGQELVAVNEIYFGHRSHQSARYKLELSDGTTERHSSSGILAGTGTGATGWLKSAWRQRNSRLALPEPQSADLCWFAREAWPSAATGADITQGKIPGGKQLVLHVESDELVCFGDGIESDALRIVWGQTLTVSAAPQTLNLLEAT